MKNILQCIHRTALRFPRAEAVVGPDYQLNYGELWSGVMQVSDELKPFGVHCIALQLPNHLDWIVTDLAAAYLGITVVPVPAFFSREQVRHLLLDSGAELLITDADVDIAGCGEQTASTVIRGHYLRLPRRDINGRPVCSKVTYTSGSTGAPKGVCLASETLDATTDALINALSPLDLHRHLCVLPYATLLENMAGIYAPLSSGRSVVCGDVGEFGLCSNHQFDVARFSRAIEQYQAESVILLPQMLAALTDAEPQQLERLRSLKFIAVGGGCVAPELIDAACARGLPVYEGYGLTECGSVVCLNTPQAFRVGSVGKPLDHARVRVNDKGEVLVSGSIMMGYIGAAVAEETIATGDLGYLDEDGFLFITGRSKNVIVSSFGRNISPEWVEARFLTQPGIEQIAVFGEARPCLSAVIHCNPAIDDRRLEQLVASVNAGLPDYARVLRWLRVDKPFSLQDGTLTANGKLCRDGLSRHYADFINMLEGVA